MWLLLKLSVLITTVAAWSMVNSEQNFCQDFESIEPCDMDVQLDVEFGRCGVRVTPMKAAATPHVLFKQADDNQKYLLIMVDPDAPSSSKPTFRYWRHWVVTNIKSSSLRSGNIKGTTRTEYNGPTPPKQSGPHRYQIFLFKQSSELNSVDTLGNGNRGKWQLGDFVKTNDLCHSLVAAYEFIAENQ